MTIGQRVSEWLLVCALALTCANASASGRLHTDIDLTGWESWGQLDLSGATNTIHVASIGSGSTVISFEWIDLSFESLGLSWRSEVVLSLNGADGSFMDWSPSSQDLPGSVVSETGAWGGTTGASGPFGQGGSFVSQDGDIFVTVYESFDDPNGDNGSVLDAAISSGTLRIIYAPVPEPSVTALLSVGSAYLLCIAARRRRSGITAIGAAKPTRI